SASPVERPMFREFDQICVVNLPERTDRRRETERELKRVGCTSNVEFFPAIRPQSAAGFGSIGEHGCYLSHMALLEKHKNANAILVLEDDIQFSDDFATASTIIGQLPPDWDFFYAGWMQLDACREDWPKAGIVPANPKSEFIGTHCYAIKGAVVPRVLDKLAEFMTRERGHPEGGRIAVDGALNLARQQLGLATYLAVPPLGHQRASRTDVGNLRWFDRSPPLRAVVGLARSFKNSVTRFDGASPRRIK
ncbi:glycosyltransferase family 25 protein, partial [Nostoc sp. NIES-2111]